jgi:manganese oxidase
VSAAATRIAIAALVGVMGAVFVLYINGGRDSVEPLAQSAPPQVRTFYVAAEEVNWDYAPEGTNVITGDPFGDDENVFVQQGDDRIGSTYKKALYREYTDASFTTKRDRGERWEHLGALGPALRAEVGDTIKVVFKNKADRPFSMHPHGVFYDKDSEGAPYNDGTSGDDKADDAVPPGETHVYTWQVPPRAGPAHHDGVSVMWMYHSHTDEVRDTNAGLMGPMIIYRNGALRPDGTVVGVDREFVGVLTVNDENTSWYLDDNIDAFAGVPGSVDPDDEDFQESNLMHGINGYVYGNQPLMTSRAGERVRWYMMGMGTEVDLHTPHWHGQTVTWMGMRTDVVDLLPASMKTADMRPDNVGTWLLHCHVNDHISAGMSTRFKVVP